MLARAMERVWCSEIAQHTVVGVDQFCGIRANGHTSARGLRSTRQRNHCSYYEIDVGSGSEAVFLPPTQTCRGPFDCTCLCRDKMSTEVSPACLFETLCARQLRANALGLVCWRWIEQVPRRPLHAWYTVAVPDAQIRYLMFVKMCCSWVGAK